MNPILSLETFSTPSNILEFSVNLIVGICIFVILTSVLINFAESKKDIKTKRRKNSVVETGTMFLFFIAFYIIMQRGIGTIAISNVPLRIGMIFFGVAVMVLGTYVNVIGRFALGKNWANQIKIYSDQTLVKKGIYSFVRHPLYASLIWMFYAACLIYPNYAAFLANTIIFMPFMYYRAKQEEQLLSQTFKDYKKYQKEVGMFFPKIR